MQLQHKAAHRAGANRYQIINMVNRERVDAMIAHARWAGKVLARDMFASFGLRGSHFVRNNGLSTEMLADGGELYKRFLNDLFRIYGVQEPLWRFATKSAVVQLKEVKDLSLKGEAWCQKC